MAFLPVKPHVGGKGGHGLKLITDMTGVGNKKVNSPHAKKMGHVGNLYKNPGGKHDSSNRKIAHGSRKTI